MKPRQSSLVPISEVSDMIVAATSPLAARIAELAEDLSALQRLVGPAPPPKGYVQLKRAAFATGYGMETLRRYALAGKIKARRVGSRWYVRLDTIPGRGNEEFKPRTSRAIISMTEKISRFQSLIRRRLEEALKVEVIASKPKPPAAVRVR